MTGLLYHIAERALGVPLLLTPDKAQVILSVLSGRIGVGPMKASRFDGSDVERTAGGLQNLPYRRTAEGVAIITVVGSLVNRGAWVGASSGLTSYEGIQHQLKSAGKDDRVKSVLLDMHTPGGEATGAFETAAMVRDLAATKRIVAVVNGLAASAGYAIASGASEIVITESGTVGSIGVVMLHADVSRAMEIAGIKPTLIFAGARKADGNPFEPLPNDVRDDLHAQVEGIYALFVATVAKGRGARLTADAARSTEARMFFGADAVKAGLADRVGTFDDVLAELSGKPVAAAKPSQVPSANSAASPLATAALTARLEDTVAAACRKEHARSPALRAVWPSLAAYAAFLKTADLPAMWPRKN